MSEEKAKELGVKPMAKFVVGASAGLDPSIMGVGPAFSTRKALEKAGMKMEDVDLVEANEAFAAQSLAVAKELNFDMNKVNVNGGAIAIGHPVGASGCRILVTLLHEMQKREDAKVGLEMCIRDRLSCIITAFIINPPWKREPRNGSLYCGLFKPQPFRLHHKPEQRPFPQPLLRPVLRLNPLRRPRYPRCFPARS